MQSSIPFFPRLLTRGILPFHYHWGPEERHLATTKRSKRQSVTYQVRIAGHVTRKQENNGAGKAAFLGWPEIIDNSACNLDKKQLLCRLLRRWESISNKRIILMITRQLVDEWQATNRSQQRTRLHYNRPTSPLLCKWNTSTNTSKITSVTSGGPRPTDADEYVHWRLNASLHNRTIASHSGVTRSVRLGIKHNSEAQLQSSARE